MVSLGSLPPMSFRLGYNFALRPSLLSLPWKSGFLSFGALRCNQISKRLFPVMPLCSCLLRDTDTVAGGDMGESVVALITLTRALPSSLPKLGQKKHSVVRLAFTRSNIMRDFQTTSNYNSKYIELPNIIEEIFRSFCFLREKSHSITRPTPVTLGRVPPCLCRLCFVSPTGS